LTQSHNLYAGIHRALRMFLTDSLGRVGWLDVGDEAKVGGTLFQVDSLLDVLTPHLEHEHAVVHTAIEACPPPPPKGTTATWRRSRRFGPNPRLSRRHRSSAASRWPGG
jgi:hypothetical protein